MEACCRHPELKLQVEALQPDRRTAEMLGQAFRATDKRLGRPVEPVAEVENHRLLTHAAHRIQYVLGRERE